MTAKRIRAVAIVVHAGRLLLMRRVSKGREYYVFPGGGVETGESVEDAVEREVREEASLEVQLEWPLYHHVYDDGSEHWFYLCRYVSGSPQLGQSNEMESMRADPSELYEPLWYEIDRLSELLLYPLEIRDWFVTDYRAGLSRKDPKTAVIALKDLRRSL
jgi:8-oxo-dGTP diphosphatase